MPGRSVCSPSRSAAQITRFEFGKPPTYSVVGWPLALIIIGVVGLAAPVLLSR